LLKQLLIRQLFPGIFPASHRPLEVMTIGNDNSTLGWCHRILAATTF
jgi:hypothetical protein